MKKISLDSSARLSDVAFKDFIEGQSVDIVYNSGGEILAGTYRWDEVKQFVRELAEALDMTLEEPAPEAEPIVLPKDVYEEVERYMKYIYSDENTIEIKRRADAKLWSLCRSANIEEGLTGYVADNAGASIDIARVFMKELPYVCEESKWVIYSNPTTYLSKSCLKDNGEWAMEFTADIEKAIKFPSRNDATTAANIIWSLVHLGVKEV